MHDKKVEVSKATIVIALILHRGEPVRCIIVNSLRQWVSALRARSILDKLVDLFPPFFNFFTSDSSIRLPDVRGVVFCAWKPCSYL
jgi:hypothetical protein